VNRYQNRVRNSAAALYGFSRFKSACDRSESPLQEPLKCRHYSNSELLLADHNPHNTLITLRWPFTHCVNRNMNSPYAGKQNLFFKFFLSCLIK